MYRSKVSKVMGMGLAVLLLAALSATRCDWHRATAAADEPETVQIPPIPVEPQPEVRDPGVSYQYMDVIPSSDLSPTKTDDPVLLQPRPRPLAIEGQPNKLSWTPVRTITMHPTNSQILYAAIDNGNGIWRSTDGGTLWERLPFGNGSGRTVVFANNNTTALATFGDWNGSYYQNGGVYRSDNGGSSWINLGTAIPRTVVAVAFDPNNAQRIYATTLGAGIYRSTNSGASWTQINTGLSEGSSPYVYSIAVSPSNPSILYAGGYNWVYRSDNGGDSWYIADGSYPAFYTEGVAVHPTNPNIFYAGAQRLGTVLSTGLTAGGFFKSVAGAGDGNLVLKNSGMQDTFVLALAQDPLNSNILYAGTWGSGFFRSDNGGVTWVAKNAGFTNPYVYSIEATTGGGGTVLYAGTFYSNAGLFKSTDRGESWTEISDGSSLYPVVFDAITTGSANNVAAATSRGAYWSNDGGQTWHAATGLVGGQHGVVLELANHFSNPTKLLAATYGGGVWTSTNAGQSWVDTSTGFASPYVYDVVFSPNSASLAYAGSYGVYRSTNGGSSWSALGSLGHWVRVVDALGGANPDLFAGTYTGGVYVSPGGSGSWSAINNNLGDLRIRSLKAIASTKLFAGTNGTSAWEYSSGSWTKRGPIITAPGVIKIAIDPSNPNILYAATDQGVYRSTNGGESWVPKNQGLGGYGDLVVSGIAIDRSNTATIYLGTWGYGIFKSTNSGDTWTRVADPLAQWQVYLPLVIKNWPTPAVPPAPTLYPIDNADGDGNYTVSWTASQGATSYRLQEDDNASFSSPITAYSGAATSKAITGKAVGTYYYRVNASNAAGTSAWSNTRSVTVSPVGGWTTIKSETFEGTFPGAWQVSDDDARNGQYYWGKRTCRPYGGSYSGWAVGGGDGAGRACGSSYPTYVYAWMVYGPFSLADASDADLTFQLWLNSEFDYDGTFRGASVNGTNFYGFTTTGNTGGWTSRELDLTAVPNLGDLTGQSSVWIALVFISDESYTYAEGAYVDNLVLRKYVGMGAGSTEEEMPPLPATAQETIAAFSR